MTTTTGLTEYIPGVGFSVDIFAVEERVDGDLRNWLSDSTGGKYFKAGKVFQKMQSFYGSSLPDVTVTKAEASSAGEKLVHYKLQKKKSPVRKSAHSGISRTK